MKIVKVNKKETKKKITRRSLLEDKIALIESKDTLLDNDILELECLKSQLKASKRGKSSRNKGATYERTIAKKFNKKYNVELTRTPQSGGFAKKSKKADDFRGNIVTVDKDLDMLLHIECKHHKTWAMKDWLKQANSDCPKGKIPVVIMHQLQEIKEGKVVTNSEDRKSVV